MGYNYKIFQPRFSIMSAINIAYQDKIVVPGDIPKFLLLEYLVKL